MRTRSGAILRKSPATLVVATAPMPFILGDRRALTTAANEIAAKTKAELHTNADSVGAAE